MGSASDWEVMAAAAETLEAFGIPYEKRVVSAHRTPDLLVEYAKTARGRGIEVIIAGAGGAAHLPGMVASMTPLPVVGVPVKSRALNGLDSLLSIVQMPAGVPVAMIVPARSVMPRVSSAMISATEWIRWSVLLFCRFSPLTVEEIASAGGNTTSSAVRMHGPIGVKPSSDLPKYHWLCAVCRLRADTSFTTV